MSALSDVKEIREFCQANFLSAVFAPSAKSVAKAVLQKSHLLPFQQKLTLIQDIVKVFQEEKSQPQKVKAVKDSLKDTSYSSWKNAILNSQYEVTMDKSYMYIQYPNSSALPLQTKARSILFSSENVNTIFGSTFATNKAHRLDTEGNHLLDAVFSATCHESTGQFTGYAIAIADGAGGHFGIEEQDKKIAHSARLATKECVRIFSAFNDPEALKSGIPEILKVIGKIVQRKTKGEGSTLAGCRAFPTENGFRIIGFNLGDNMVIAWDKTAQQAYHLSASHASEAGTALLPSAYKEFEVNIIDQELNEGSDLILMTDGIHDTLPHIEESGEYPNKLQYTTRKIDDLQNLFSQVKVKSPASNIKSLVKASFKGAEQLRLSEEKNVDVQIGDDMTITHCHLIKPQS